ncbi:hypothetical protein [Microbacterium elymi]|uniref:Uncharacterized protein n=1 Tax=Microbacterium elymi TaxID=2909587 RepID=A0ABY5NH88_9MICO|nr:hypothetical protein [Microbacterium elymi]UUT34494.1 hypothetical protein L2X98_28495 [Microbacterium elymi]
MMKRVFCSQAALLVLGQGRDRHLIDGLDLLLDLQIVQDARRRPDQVIESGAGVGVALRDHRGADHRSGHDRIPHDGHLDPGVLVRDGPDPLLEFITRATMSAACVSPPRNR